MRVDVKKFLFVGLEEDRALFFKKAQEMGMIHFIDFHAGKSRELPQELQNITIAIKILRGLPTTPQIESKNFLEADEIAHKIITLKEQLDNLNAETRVLNIELARIHVFGQFRLEDLAYIQKVGKRCIQFFFTREGVIPDEEIPENVFYVGSDHSMDYFFAINREPKSYDKMTEMHFERSKNELQARLAEVKKSHHETEKELKTFAKYHTFLHHALNEKLNSYHLAANQTYAKNELGKALFVVEGWVPEDKREMVEQLVQDLHVYHEEIAILPEDVVPTYLENTGMNRVGEDLVHIYDTPSFKDKDPSLWVLYFFALFFAMIVNDAGYGLVYLVISLSLLYLFPKAKGAAKRLLKLMTLLSVFCVGWGVLVNAYFGINLPLDSPLRKISAMHWLEEKNVDYHMQHRDATYQEWLHKYPQLSQAHSSEEAIKAMSTTADGKENYVFIEGLSRNILMELALMIGVLHLILSFLRYIKRNKSGMGWIAFLIGAYLYLPSYLKVTSIIHYAFGVPVELGAQIGVYLMIGGGVAALVFGVLQHQWEGVAEMAHVIQVFADVMSYLRLYALGLAGAVVAITINELSGSLPLFIGIILIVISHAINMLLGIMSGIIHGLRLNFLEWYRYSFEGGGKLFNPLRLLDIE